ncbi:hypothetical protein S83_058310 [Arachis hypogaea]
MSINASPLMVHLLPLMRFSRNLDNSNLSGHLVSKLGKLKHFIKSICYISYG